MKPGIVIHCADTYPDMDIGVAEIDQWHKKRGWDGIGYHFVIRRNGAPETGRDIDKPGAHAKGYNDYIGICMVGGKARPGNQACNFTQRQWDELYVLVSRLQKEHGIPDINVIGHNEVSDKTCPTFDVRAWMEK